MPSLSESSFPAISPAMARERFLIQDESWTSRFKPNFNQFIISSLEYGRPVIKLPLPPSRTSNHALFLVTAGQLTATVGQHSYTLAAQDVLMVPAMQIFSLIDIPENARGFMCFFSNELVLNSASDVDFDFLKLTSQPRIPLSIQQTGFITNILDRLTIDYYENGADKTDLIRPYLAALLIEINRVYVSKAPAKIDAGDRLVQRFMDLLTESVREKRLVSQYADQLNVSPNHLNKVVKAHTGQSPSVWIDERIVLETKVLLFQSNLTVAQIALEMGFDDQSSFGKLFRKYTHLSPTDFRKMIALDQL
ncbi:helix-turn-helix domain-containing protein [Spirosoma radiotolerans]|uniref:AraC family transcriptional regulator n=1 Tax=Spirosoma radiotolerans TaxID=1379870 RepID=A0A0E3ZX05_9BACT|nr:helix-turn-helix domain-containing protein [Spirosoma radiotolerans]AKD55958.1 AraC family transcriptional regulator [Spirosoma radiotolerans]